MITIAIKKCLSLGFILFCFHPLLSQSNEIYREIEQKFEQEDYRYIVGKSGTIQMWAESRKDSLAAEILYYLGDSYLAFDSIEAALKIMEEELTIREILHPEGNLIIADSHFNLGLLFKSREEFNSAIKHLTEASELYKKSNVSASSYADTQLQLAQIYRIQSLSQQALDILYQLEKNALILKEYQFTINKEIGIILFETGNYTKAEDILDTNRQLTAEKYGKESIQYLEATITAAMPKFYRSKYAESEELFLEALELNNKMNFNKNFDRTIKNSLAILYWRIGLYKEAKELFQNLLTQEPGLETASTLYNYGTILSNLSEADSAIVYITKALDMVEDILGTNNETYARFLKEKAVVYLETDKLQHFIDAMLESYAIAKNILKESNPEYSKYEFQLGRAYYRLGDMINAEKHIEMAFQLRSKYLNKNHPLFAEVTKEMAELKWQKNEIKEASKLYEQTFTNYFSQIDTYFPSLSEQEKANFYGNILKPAFEEFNTFAIQHHQKNNSLLAEMYNYQLATKGLVMYATAKARENILTSKNKQLIRKFESWMEIKELLARLYSLSEAELEEQPHKIDSLTKEANALEKALSRESAEFNQAYQVRKFSWKDVQNQLEEGEAAIEVIRFKKFKPDSSGFFTNDINYAALLIDKKCKKPELILLKNGNELEGKYINNYRNSIMYKVRDQYSYDNYWRKIAEQTTKYKTVYLAPDGIFNKININSIYNPATGKYVLEEQNIRTLTNTKDLIAYHTTESSVGKNLNEASLFGFPNYNKGLTDSLPNKRTAQNIVKNVSLDRGLRGSLRQYIRGNALVTPLPGTKKEVEKIEKIHYQNGAGKPKIFLANEADERSLKALINPAVLHIATHGFFLEDNKTSSAKNEVQYVQNPLLKSGLIMAGSNNFISGSPEDQSDQDGILTAYEAMNLNLKDTELVVLSACETGLGELKNGEGVYGLRRAFQVAGAKTIIMSLWAVDDAATQELMTGFYQQWLSGKTKQEAFTNSQLSVKNKYKDPYYWGAFVMVGE